MITPCGGDGYTLFPEQGTSGKKARYTFRCNCGFESEWLYKSSAQARIAVAEHQNLEEPAEEEDNDSEEDPGSSEDPQDA